MRSRISKRKSTIQQTMNINRHKSELEINDPLTQPLHPNTSLNPPKCPCHVASVSLAPAGSGRPGPPLPSTNLVSKQANRATHTPHNKSVPLHGQGERFKVFARLFMFCTFVFLLAYSCRSCRRPLAQSTSARHGEHMIAWASTRFLSPSLPISLHPFPHNSSPKP